MSHNSTPFSGRVTIAAGAAETFIVPLALANSSNRSPVLTYVCIEPDAANVTSIEVGFQETTTGAFQPRFETTSAAGRKQYDGMLQTGPRGGKVAARIVTSAAGAVRVIFDGEMVDG